MNRLKRFSYIIAGSVLLVAGSNVALADSISDTLTVFGTSRTATEPLTQGASETSITIGAPAGVILPNVAVILTDPNGAQSDLVISSTASGRSAVTLFSDSSTSTIPTGFTVFKIAESGAPQDISNLFGQKNGTIVAQSDLNAAPEPGTLLLLATGVAAVSLHFRRSRWPQARERCRPRPV